MSCEIKIIKLNENIKKSLILTKKIFKIFKEKESKNEFSGRVLTINNNDFFICKENKIEHFIYNGVINFKVGDLIKVFYKKNNEEKIAENIEILNNVVKSPINIKKSVFNRLTNNSFKLYHTLKKRQLFFHGVYNFFFAKGFIEINTPTLVESPGVEKYLGVFETNYFDINGNGKKFFLPTSPEFSLKEALASGLTNVFEICKCFRNNGENSTLHRPEFFMLEFYRADSSYFKIIEDLSQLMLFLSYLIRNKPYIYFKDRQVDFRKVRICKLKDLFSYHKIDLNLFQTSPQEFKKQIQEALNLGETNLTKEDLFFKFMLEKIEPELGFDHPTFVIDYPIDIATLSKKCEYSDLYGERFELYICGIEIANGYGELISSEEQTKRFKKTIEERKELGLSELPFPERFIKSLEEGIPPSAGIAVGLERLFMILSNIQDINETNLIELFSGT